MLVQRNRSDLGDNDLGVTSDLSKPGPKLFRV